MIWPSRYPQTHRVTRVGWLGPVVLGANAELPLTGSLTLEVATTSMGFVLRHRRNEAQNDAVLSAVSSIPYTISFITSLFLPRAEFAQRVARGGWAAQRAGRRMYPVLGSVRFGHTA